MARARASESRKAKPSAVEELNHAIEKLRELSTQIDDLSRDGFPYREAGRARTELSLRETIRRHFGEKSPEYQAYKNHKLRVGSRAESAHSTALIKQLIASLESQKADLVGVKPPSQVTPPVSATERPTLTAVPLKAPSDSLATRSAPEATPIDAVTTTGESMAVSASMTPDFSTPPQARDSVTVTAPAVPSSAAVDEMKLPSTAAATTSPSLRAIIPQGTISPVPQTIPPPASRPGPETESLPACRSASGSADPPGSIPSSVADSISTPISASVDALIKQTPRDERNTAATVASERVPTRPLSHATQPAQPTVVSRIPVTQVPQKVDAESDQADTGTLEILRRICTRFHLVARQLRLRKEYRPTLEITDEYDLQDLFYALLRLQFDEVATEERAPDYASGARRTSYLLDWERTVVVVKHTRSGLTTKDLAEQVQSDAAHYATRPNGGTLLCFIYDPEGRVGNPRGLEADLTTVSDMFTVEVIVAPK